MKPSPDVPNPSTEASERNPLSLPCKTDWAHFHYFHSLLHPTDPARPLSNRERRQRLGLVLAAGLSLLAVAVASSTQSCSQQHTHDLPTALQRFPLDADRIPATRINEPFGERVLPGIITPPKDQSLIPEKSVLEREPRALGPEPPQATPQARNAHTMRIVELPETCNDEKDDKPASPPTDLHMPAKTAEVVQRLCDLHTAVTGGVTFEKYSGIVDELLPAVQLFVDTNDPRLTPHLAMLLRNAIGCYTRVKVIWKDALFAKSPQARYDALALLKIARGPLWETGFSNIETAKKLIGADAADRSLALQQLLDDPQRMRIETVLDAAMVGLQSQNGLAPTAIAIAEIDLVSLRRTAEELRRRVSATEHFDLIEDFLKLTRPREWTAKNGKKIWGEPISVRQSSIHLSTNKGTAWVERSLLNATSQTVIERTASLGIQIQVLSEAIEEAKASR